MEQIERIEHMERQLEVAERAVRKMAEALEEYQAAQEALQELEVYYGSEAWTQDFAADEAGLLPQDMKCGVLSEDAAWNVLEAWQELKPFVVL